MVSFALITEGPTDQAVLRNILIGLYGSDVEVNGLQPLYDATDTSRAKPNSFGNWENVFEYCQHANLDDLFLTNDYVIIQIDTDVAEHPNFGINLTKNGVDRPVIELVEDVRKKIIEKFNQLSYGSYKNQFAFAISVHSLECWLLPLYAQIKNHEKKIKNCESRLKYETEKLGLNSNKEYRPYDELSRQYRKPKEFEKATQHHQSLALFLDSLPPL